MRPTVVLAGGVLASVLVALPTAATARPAPEDSRVVRPVPIPHVDLRGPRPVPMPDVQRRGLPPVPMPHVLPGGPLVPDGGLLLPPPRR